jgi:hypothetical protein
MKRLTLSFMKATYFILLLSIISSSNLIAKIKNGYMNEYETNRSSLQKVKLLLANDKSASSGERLKMKLAIENLTNAITCYALTEELLSQFRIISPGLYDQIDSLKDKRQTDVYVRIVTRAKAKVQLKAATFFKFGVGDEDACYSPFGANSVSIEILVDNNALFLLSHELGHVRYVVPNVSSYATFYARQYGKSKGDLSFIGHSRYDESGKYANAFQKQFLVDKQLYFDNGGNKPESMFTHFAQERKRLRNRESLYPRSVVASRTTFKKD